MIDVIKFGLLKSRQAILGLRTQQVINMMWTAYSTKTKTQSPPLCKLVDEIFFPDQSEAGSHTMRHRLSLPPFPLL